MKTQTEILAETTETPPTPLDAARDSWLGAVARYEYSPNSETKRDLAACAERLDSILDELHGSAVLDGLEAALDDGNAT